MRRPTWRSAAPWLIVGAGVALVLRALWNGGGSFDEALVLVQPERLLKGDVPNEDFIHLYGPGSLYMLAGWYRVAGVSLAAERTWGLFQLLATLAALMVLVRPFGRRVATLTGLVAIPLVLLPTGLAALAWWGAVALGLWSVAFGLRALHGPADRRTGTLVLAGLLAGMALSFRPDMVLALGLVWVLLLRRSGRLWPFLGGLSVGLCAWWVHLATVGLGTAWRGAFADPVLHLRAGRSLPRPPSWTLIDGALQAANEFPFPTPWWGLPALPAPKQMFLWFFVVVAMNVTIVVIAARRAARLRDTSALVLLTVALFGLGLTGQAWQRPDSTHLALGWLVSAALTPVLAHVWLNDHRARVEALLGRARRVIGVLPAAITLSMLLIVCPYYTLRPYLVDVRASLGNLPMGHQVHRGERTFVLGSEQLSTPSQGAIDALDAQARPGERLFVGPADLRRTVYNDPFFYHLFPELVPATYFIELDPGLANAVGSPLADDISGADWVILTNFWTGWYEPNSSADEGPDAPNKVIAEQFCLVESFDDAMVLLYHRCAEGDGVEPWTLGIGPERLAELHARQAAFSSQG